MLSSDLFYNELAAGYEQLHKEEQFAKLRLIKQNLDVPAGAKILDIGSGPGWSREFFENVTCVDPAADLLPEHGVLGNAERLPFADHSFDIILCVTAVHHFELDKALAEMKRVAKKDAVFVVTVLKKSPRYGQIVAELQRQFTVEKELDAGQDTAFFLR